MHPDACTLKHIPTLNHLTVDCLPSRVNQRNKRFLTVHEMGLKDAPTYIYDAKTLPSEVLRKGQLGAWPQEVNPNFDMDVLVDTSFLLHVILHSQPKLAFDIYQAGKDGKVLFSLLHLGI